MKIKSIEDVKTLFSLLDNGDVIITKDKDWSQFKNESGFSGGAIDYPAFVDKATIIDNGTFLNYGGKTICVKISNES